MYSAEEHIRLFEKVFGPHLISLRQTEAYKYLSENIIGSSPILEEIRFLTERFAHSNYNLLLLGETGTGKELIAQSIHNLSTKFHKKTGRFIIVNCPAIPFDMIESELFGQMKGSFTGALYDKAGILELGNGGTIFFDELDQMSVAAQAKLLRVIDAKEFSRLGSNKLIRLENTRIVASCKPNIQELIGKQALLRDVFGRLNSCFPILPPLREIKSDIPELVDYFIKKQSSKLQIHKSAMKIIQQQPWLENTRELKIFIENLILLYPEDIHDVGEDEANYAFDVHYKGNTISQSTNQMLNGNIQLALETVEKPEAREWFLKFSNAIQKLGNSKSIIHSKDLAEELNIDPAIISRKLKEYKLYFKKCLHLGELPVEALKVLLQYQPFKRLLRD